jgi:cytoskeleton protein RodZ
METLGEFLQGIRKYHKLRLEDIALKTRISIARLEALESNQFEKIPNEVIARGFVRSYVKCIGVDEDEALAIFDQSVRPIFKQRARSQDPLPPQTVLIKPKEIRSNWIGRISAVLFIGLIFISLFIVSLERLNQKLPLTISSQQEINQVTSEKYIESRISMEDTLDPANDVSVNIPVLQEVEPPILQERELLQLTIEAVERGWVLVDIDGIEFREVVLQPGDKINWAAKERFSLNLGNAGGVKVYFNGKFLESFGPSGSVVRDIILTSD